MKVHLVDGTFELFRCYYGAPKAVAADGREVGASRGFCHTLVKLLRGPDVSHVAVAFDAVVAPRRRPGGRGASAGGTDAELGAQYPIAADLVRALGLTIWPMSRFQADEALATGAARFRDVPGVEQVVIATTDNDLFQCVVGERVVVWDRVRDRVTSEAGVRARFGIRPDQIPELFALTGDVSDGLPGIPGWGVKSSARVLSRYGRIEDIPLDPAAWDVRVRGAKRLAESLRERRREAILYRNLATLRADVPLPDTLSDLAWPGASHAALEPLARAIGAEDVLERVPRWR